MRNPALLITKVPKEEIMTTREKVEFALDTSHGDWHLAFYRYCFHCKYLSASTRSIREHQRQMAFALLMLGVPYGDYQTFRLNRGCLCLSSNVGRCGQTSEPDPDWQRFIDEVVSIVDNQGS
jgi:hypothetical protein